MDNSAASLHRYEISAIVGPCLMEEAEAMLDRLAQDGSLGAAWGIQRLGNDFEEADRG